MLRIVHSAAPTKPEKKKVDSRREKAMVLVQRQQAINKEKAALLLQKEIEAVRLIDPTFQL